jgi:hypothetical protein
VVSIRFKKVRIFNDLARISIRVERFVEDTPGKSAGEKRLFRGRRGRSQGGIRAG